MAVNFDKYAQEGNRFIKELAEKLGHPDEISRTGIILRSVLHTLRDRITISESLNFMAQLPSFIKVVYVEDWKYHEKPIPIRSPEDFTEQVKENQKIYGEQEFSWSKSTEEIVRIVIESISTYVTEGEAEDIVAQLPEDLKQFFKEIMHV